MSDLEQVQEKPPKKRKARRKKHQLGLFPGMDKPLRPKPKPDKYLKYNRKRREMMKIQGLKQTALWLDEDALDAVKDVRAGEDLDNRDQAANLLIRLGIEKYREMNNK